MIEHHKTILYETEGSIATITLNRPPLNLINRDMALEYMDVLSIADKDPKVKVIILTGAGKGLSGGVDIRFIENIGSSEMHDFLVLFYVKMTEKVRALSKPIIASVHGYAREGACTLAFACDMVLASEDATFGYPGVRNLAAPPGMHVWHLQRLMGRMKAAELIFTADPIDARNAERAGLITRVVPSDKLGEETRRLASRIAEMSPLALKVTRELFYRMEDMEFSTVPGTAADTVALCFDFEDSKEARKAFTEKRKPVWQGK
jgi:enoyl-CoA hydratase/carnithine racemase